MLKKTITYTDYDGNKRTEDFYFNINKAEMTRMQMSENGGYANYIRKIINENDSSKLYSIFEHIICLAYGEKSLDGKRFIKSEELTENFKQTEAYSELIMELFNNSAVAAQFFKGILPADVVEQIKDDDLKELTK